MRTFTITGTSNGKIVQPVLNYHCEDFTVAMQRQAMHTIQMFHGNKSIQFTITNTNA